MFEEEFLLLYYINGMTPDRVHSFSPFERDWYLTRLYEQLKNEEKKIKNATGG